MVKIVDYIFRYQSLAMARPLIKVVEATVVKGSEADLYDVTSKVSDHKPPNPARVL